MVSEKRNNSSMMHIQVLLLCAGKGSRFDPSGQTSKLLAPLAAGETVLGAVLQHLLGVCPQPLAIVNTSQHQVKDFLTERAVSWIEVTDDKLSMGYSIAAGVRHSEEADGWLICLGDMPYIQSSIIAQVLDVASQNPEAIVAPVCDGQRGHPVFIPSRFKEDLLNLQKDEGPRHLMKHGPLVLISTRDTGIYRDIDVPSDLI